MNFIIDILFIRVYNKVKEIELKRGEKNDFKLFEVKRQDY